MARLILLDAYALIAFVAGGPAQGEVRGLLRQERCGAATANLIEVLDVAKRVRGVQIGRAREVIEPLLADVLTAIPLDLDRAWRAAGLRADHYDRRTCPVSLADCVLVASAADGDCVATSDRHVLEVSNREGVGTLPLPDERGRRPVES